MKFLMKGKNERQPQGLSQCSFVEGLLFADIEAEVSDIPILDNVFFPFEA